MEFNNLLANVGAHGQVDFYRDRILDSLAVQAEEQTLWVWLDRDGYFAGEFGIFRQVQAKVKNALAQ